MICNPRPMKAFPLAAAARANIQTALEHHLAGRLVQAEALYRKILHVEPDHPDALYLSGVLAQQTGNMATAIDFLCKAAAAQPSNSMYSNTLGNLFRDNGWFDEAAACYRQALASTPDDIATLCNLANVFQHQRRYTDAIACYDRVLAINPDHAETCNDLGVALLAQGKLDEAMYLFKRVLALQPDFSEARNNLGAVFKNQGKLEEAIACYQQALAIKPDYAKALFNLGTAYFVKKDFPRAMAWYQASLAINPDQVEAHQNIAAILLDAGRREEAQLHRDAAYRRQSLFVDTAPEPVYTVLVLWAAGKGNVPIDFLLPVKSVTRIVWMMEYAAAKQERTLPAYDLVFNAIGDPDVTAPTAGPVARFLQNCRKPVLNLPDAVACTARDLIDGLFFQIPGVLVPSTIRIGTGDLKQRLLTLPGMCLPLLIRPGGSHGGEHFVRLESLQELNDLEIFNADFYYVSAYHDYRSRDGYYRKYRMIFVDRQPYPYHLAIGKQWMVHYETADMLGNAWKLDEEARFLENPAAAIGAPAMAAIEAIGRKLDLDYCGIDFSVLPDGRVLVFEANATMLVHPEHMHGPLHFKNMYVQRIFGAFNALLSRIVRPAGES